MNKQRLLFFISLAGLFLGLAGLRPVFGQRQLEDYLFQYDQYRQVYDSFTVSRDKYLQYSGLSVLEAAIENTRRLVLQRNQTLRTYFLALEHRVRNTAGVIETGDDGLTAQLDKQIVWLEEQNQAVKGLANPSLEDLFILSDRVEDKEEELTRLGYLSLSQVILGRIRDLHSESVAITNRLKNQVSESASATQAAQLNLWIKELGVKNYLSQKEIEAAEVNLWKLRGAGDVKKMQRYFSDLKIDVDDAKIQLDQAADFQQEIYSALEL